MAGLMDLDRKPKSAWAQTIHNGMFSGAIEIKTFNGIPVDGGPVRIGPGESVTLQCGNEKVEVIREEPAADEPDAIV